LIDLRQPGLIPAVSNFGRLTVEAYAISPQLIRRARTRHSYFEVAAVTRRGGEDIIWLRHPSPPSLRSWILMETSTFNGDLRALRVGQFLSSNCSILEAGMTACVRSIYPIGLASPAHQPQQIVGMNDHIIFPNWTEMEDEEDVPFDSDEMDGDESDDDWSHSGDYGTDDSD
jgi:hypothetical protein